MPKSSKTRTACVLQMQVPINISSETVITSFRVLDGVMDAQLRREKSGHRFSEVELANMGSMSRTKAELEGIIKTMMDAEELMHMEAHKV